MLFAAFFNIFSLTKTFMYFVNIGLLVNFATTFQYDIKNFCNRLIPFPCRPDINLTI